VSIQDDDITAGGIGFEEQTRGDVVYLETSGEIGVFVDVDVEEDDILQGLFAGGGFED